MTQDLRCFSDNEINQNLKALHQFRTSVFGDDVIPFPMVKLHHSLGQDIYSVFGHIDHSGNIKPSALFHAFMISHNSYTHIQNNEVDERFLKPWDVKDGKAVMWITSCISFTPRGALRVIDDALGKISEHPYLENIDTLGAFATEKGTVLARAMGLSTLPKQYKNGEPFFEFPISKKAIESLAFKTMNVYNAPINKMYKEAI